MKVLVLGADGQLGSELCRQFGDQAIGTTRRCLDISVRSQVLSTIRNVCPDVLINSAAYTNVDRAEFDRKGCIRVNSDGVAHVTEACAAVDCVLVHISSDYVFGADCHRKMPYVEDDLPAPVNVYGQSKMEGEAHVQKYPKHLLVRTCGLYTSPYVTNHHNNFVASMLRFAQEQKQLRVVDDQCCTPTFIPHLVQAIRQLIECEKRGTYHLTNSGETNWYEFAKEIFHLVRVKPTLVPISSKEYAASAPRPHYSVLNINKFMSSSTLPLTSWKEALLECLREK